MSTLTDQDKRIIATAHLKNVESNLYNLQLSLIEEKAKSNLSQENIDSLELQIQDISAQKSALESELAKLVTE